MDAVKFVIDVLLFLLSLMLLLLLLMLLSRLWILFSFFSVSCEVVLIKIIKFKTNRKKTQQNNYFFYFNIRSLSTVVEKKNRQITIFVFNSFVDTVC